MHRSLTKRELYTYSMFLCKHKQISSYRFLLFFLVLLVKVCDMYDACAFVAVFCYALSIHMASRVHSTGRCNCCTIATPFTLVAGSQAYNVQTVRLDV